MTKSMPGAASSPGAAGAKAGTPEPFRLASMERHQKAQEELARKVGGGRGASHEQRAMEGLEGRRA